MLRVASISQPPHLPEPSEHTSERRWRQYQLKLASFTPIGCDAQFPLICNVSTPVFTAAPHNGERAAAASN